MFGKYPQAEYPNLCITVVRYSASIKEISGGAARILDNQKLEGTIPDMLVAALDVVRRNMQRRTLKSGLISEEIMEYPELAIREVLVNAVGHRDYGPGALGSQVQVKMFSDGLVVQSPGGLFGPVTEETLDEVGVQATRNVHLMKMLEEIGLAENRGSGIRTVIAQLAKAHLPPPEFKDGRTFFRVTFFNEFSSVSAETAVSSRKKDWKPRHLMVFGFIQREGIAAIQQIAKGCNMSLPYARLAVSELLKIGALESTEKNKRSPKQAYRVRKRG